MHFLGEQIQSFCYQQDLNVQVVCHTYQLTTVQNPVSLVSLALALSDASERISYRALSDAAPRSKIAAVTPPNLGNSQRASQNQVDTFSMSGTMALNMQQSQRFFFGYYFYGSQSRLPLVALKK